MQQLKGAAPPKNAPVAIGAAKIRINHPHQSELGKMMALSHDLRADQHVDLAFGHGADRALGFGRAMHGIVDEAMA